MLFVSSYYIEKGFLFYFMSVLLLALIVVTNVACSIMPSTFFYNEDTDWKVENLMGMDLSASVQLTSKRVQDLSTLHDSPSHHATTSF